MSGVIQVGSESFGAFVSDSHESTIANHRQSEPTKRVGGWREAQTINESSANTFNHIDFIPLCSFQTQT